jgi:acyl dehydratase
MPLNPSMKGKEYTPITLPVDRGDVLRFAEAIGEDNPVFRDPRAARDAGYPEQVAPPTFVTRMQIMASAQVVLDQALGLNYAMVVHGEQEYRWERLAVVGDVLSAVPRIADIYTKKSNEYLVIEAEIKAAGGETVVVGRSTLISRGTGGG